MIRERERQTASGLLMVFVFLILMVVAGFGFVSAVRADDGGVAIAWALLLALCSLGLAGLFTVAPNEARVLQLFGAYRGSVRDEGLRWANPFYTKKRISLRVRNFESAKLKVNDTDGNPIEIAAIVVWKVVDSAEAVFEVDDYENYVRDALPVRRARGRAPVAARLDRRGRQGAEGRDPRPPRQGRRRGSRGAHQPPGLRVRDRVGDAAPPAGGRHHRGAAEDRRGRGGDGGDGARAALEEQPGEARRGAQGGDGLEPARRPVR